MKKFYFIFILLFLIYFIFIFSNCCFAAWGEPELVTKLNKAFESIQEWLIKLATPAAAVAVATGAFMRKFSFGDEEKIRTGKKLINGSLFSYGFILAINLILSAIKSLIG